MEKSSIIVAVILTSIFGVSLLGYGQDNQTEFTEQDKRGIAFAGPDAQKAIKEGKIYVISGGYANAPIVNEADLELVKGLPMKTIGCTGDFEYAKKFNATVIQYLKQNITISKDLSKEDIVRIATDKAKGLGYKPEEMNIVYDEGNSSIKEHLKRIGVSTYNEKTKK